MNKFVASIACVALACSMSMAQKADRKPMSDQERTEWLNELRSHKHDYLTRELELTQQQQEHFFPVYDEMDDKLNQIASETRDLEEKVSADASASDTEIEAAARALFEQKSREGKVDEEYFSKFKEILTPKQLLRLKNAERKFTQQLLWHRGKSKDGRRK